MNIILLGAPGAGKGTQAELIMNRFGSTRIATGDMLRTAIKEKSSIGLKVQDIMAQGKLVPESVILDLVTDTIKSLEPSQPVLFDGFPRTIHQAEFLKENDIPINYVIDIAVPDEVIIARLSGRWVHQESGRIYHTQHNPPKVEGVDDKTGDPLTQRPDDKPETVKHRLEVYHETTFPVVKWYKDNSEILGTKFVSIDGEQEVEKVFADICSALEK